MKKIIPTLMIILFSTTLNAQNHYKNLWEKVKKLEADNLPKSALKIVSEIYLKAEKENNSTQIIKCLFYKSKFSLILEENAQFKIISQFKKHIKKSTFPTKNILENVLANLYWQYFNQNRWNFYNRTQLTTKTDNIDFRTWDLNTLFSEIHLQYQNSLKNKKKLQKTDINQFANILQLKKDSKNYRPTLYDFLANNALDFYKTDETHISKPINNFKINNENLLSNAEYFSTLNLKTQDSTSLKFNALKIYQNLTSFHLLNKNLDALADTDLDRIKFVNTYATFSNKNKCFLETLKTTEQRYKDNEISGLYAYEIAKITTKQANYKIEKDRFKNKEALDICNDVIKRFPKSNAAKKCIFLKQQILSKSLYITAEKFTPIQQFQKVLVTYKNVNILFFSIYKINENKLQKLHKLHKKEDKTNFIKKLSIIKKWSVSLKNEHDYLQHTTEVIVPKLPQGNYLFVVSNSKNLSKNTAFSFEGIQITNLAFVQNSINGKSIYQIINRNTGKPISNAIVNLHNKPHKNNRYFKKLDKFFISNKNGEFTFNSNQYYGTVKANVSYKTDNAVFDGIYINNYHKPLENKIKKHSEITIFTDRSIYRPNQIVYFKGILFEKTIKKTNIIPHKKIIISLNDANYQVIKKLELTTNEFGSFSGSFILPNNVLTGNFNLISTYENNTFSTSISVEEYKRPNFKADFKPITKSYQLNNEIELIGFAKSFSGTKITNANVSYRVHRKTQYPSWSYWYRPNFNISPQEIKNGELTTDEKGYFTIKFNAIPDEYINKSNNPIFTYIITADITDINGETHTAQTEIKVGYQSLIATISIDNILNTSNKNNSIKIDTKNLNGEFISAKGTIKIYKLLAPKNILRKRPWNAPDYQEISNEEFREKFPNESYKNEDNFMNWKKGMLVFSKDFNTKKNKEIILKETNNWQSGKYCIELTSKDQYGQKLTEKKFFSARSDNDILPTDNQLFYISCDKETYKINDIAKITISTNSEDITVMLFVKKQHQVIENHYIHLNKSSKTISVPIAKSDEGGFGISYYFINYNSFISGSKIIKVPYTKTDLEITSKTFRDKLQPGKNQTWSFSIKGSKKDKTLAEVLANMYDVSLDEIKPHNWQFNPIYKPIYNIYSKANAQSSFQNLHLSFNNLNTPYSKDFTNKNYPRFNWFGFYFGNKYKDIITSKSVLKFKSVTPNSITINKNIAFKEAENVIITTKTDENETTNNKEIIVKKPSFKDVQIRKNLQETAFFYPHLTTDKNGNICFNFTSPESLTRWKLQLLAHTKELHSAIKTLETVTQKELMISSNVPRFLRQEDKITLRAKISNLSDKKLQGFAQLILTDVITGKEINLLNNSNKNQKFIVTSHGNTKVSWDLYIPNSVNAIQYKFIAKAGNFSDGEQNVIPVLSNKILVTETLPIWVGSNQNKTFLLKKLLNTQQLKTNKQTLKHHKLTLEITSNPVWYAVQALPYLMESPYECSEQTFARYYANSLAKFIANSNPRIQEVFNEWKNTDALLSNLEKNQELKSLIIKETPWLRDAQSETEQKKRIALLFDKNTIKNEQEKAISKLQNMQMSNGGFPWFKGGHYPNTYITQHIVSGFGHLKKLGVINFDANTQKLIEKAVKFIDDEISEKYQNLLKQAKIEGNKFLAKKNIHYFELQYLYMRSFYTDIAISKKTQKAINYYKNQSVTYWNDFNLYGKGLIALVQFREGKKSISTKILASLKENSITSEELGMYWKSNTTGYYNYQHPTETQALLIETFSEIENDTNTVDNLKIWLLKNKQVSHWKTTKATTEAVYALLLQGSNWSSISNLAKITLGDTKIDPAIITNTKTEAGTGYFKTSWNDKEITYKKGKVTISKKGKGIAWGGLYWQYFENLEKITSAKTPLKLHKKLFKKVNSNTGKKLIEVTNKTILKVGDLLTVRIELHLDRNIDFIHIKDMRASGIEPINTISQYKWQDGLGYYESTKDASTNFFFDHLPKGVYVFEYDVRTNNAGNFSNGITTIESMYAPEFKSHSEDIRINIE